MKLFTKEVDKQLFAQYPKGSDLENQMVVAKIFNPYGRGVWYLLNSDPEDPDYIWAIVDLFEPDMGSVSRSELQTVKVPPFGLGLERDIYFTPKPAKEVFDGIMRGERFAQGGMTAGRYYKDNSGNEFRFIGESEGKLLFKDGEKIVTKSEEDFEDAPKEKKLFGIFADGGAVKGRNNQTGEYYGVVIGSVQKADDEYTDAIKMNVRTSYEERICESSVLFDKNGNLLTITDYGCAYEGKYPSLGVGSGRNYYADKKETLQILSKKYNPAFAKKLIELAKDIKMAEGGMVQHGLKIGDKITTDMFWDNQIVVENQKTKKRAQINLETGVRKEEMAKGGDTAAAEHNIKQAKYGARLVGKQKNLDVNKNGKLDAEDFKMLRGEKMAKGGEMGKHKWYVVSAKEDKVVSKGFDSEEEAKKEMYELYEKNKDFSLATRKMADGAMLDTMEQVMTFEEFKKKLPILHDIKAGDNGVEYKPKYNKYTDTIMYFKNGRTNSEKVSLSVAYKHYKYFLEKGEEYASGGKVKFEDKVKEVQKSLLKRKKVAPVVQKDYGKTYNRKEALESAKRIIGAQTAKWEKRNKK